MKDEKKVGPAKSSVLSAQFSELSIQDSSLKSRVSSLKPQYSALSTQHSLLSPLSSVLYVLLCLAGVLRLADLGSKSLWVDEACGLAWNADSIERINQRCRETHTAPLREYYLHFCWKLPRGMLEAASRLPSALAGILIIPLLFFLGRRMFGWETGLFAALFAFAHPWLVQHSQDNRMHVLNMGFSALLLYQLWGLLHQKHSLRGWMLFGVVLALYGWFSRLSIMVYPALAGLIVVEGISRLARRERRPEFARLVGGALIALLVFAVMYAPQLGNALRVVRLYVPSAPSAVSTPPTLSDPFHPSDQSYPSDQSHPFTPVPPSPPPASTYPPEHRPYKTHLSFAYLKSLLLEIGGGQNAVPGIGGEQWAAAVISFCLAIFGLAALALTQRRALWVPFFWFLAPLPILAFTSAKEFFPPRYVLYFTTVYALLAGRGAAVLFRVILVRSAGFSLFSPVRSSGPGPSSPAPPKTSVRKALIPPLIAGMLVAGPLLVADGFGLARYYANEKQNWREAVTFLKNTAQSGDRVIFGDLWAESGWVMYRDPVPKKRLEVISNALSLGDFALAVQSADNVWYLYWAPLPQYIQEIVDKTMDEVRSYPGLLGTVHLMRKKSYREVAPIVLDKSS